MQGLYMVLLGVITYKGLSIGIPRNFPNIDNLTIELVSIGSAMGLMLILFIIPTVFGKRKKE